MLSLQLHLKLSNQTDRELGPFEVSLLYDGLHEEKVVMINGLQTMVILPSFSFFFLKKEKKKKVKPW